MSFSALLLENARHFIDFHETRCSWKHFSFLCHPFSCFSWQEATPKDSRQCNHRRVPCQHDSKERPVWLPTSPSERACPLGFEIIVNPSDFQNPVRNNVVYTRVMAVFKSVSTSSQTSCFTICLLAYTTIFWKSWLIVANVGTLLNSSRMFLKSGFVHNQPI